MSLPKKHSRGGQSATRFARLRVESRRNYLRKVAEEATRVFITDNKCNVEGMVLAGLADFKHQLNKSDLFDKYALGISIACSTCIAWVVWYKHAPVSRSETMKLESPYTSVTIVACLRVDGACVACACV